MAPEFGKSLGENGLLESPRGLKSELFNAFFIVSSPNKCFLSVFFFLCQAWVLHLEKLVAKTAWWELRKLKADESLHHEKKLSVGWAVKAAAVATFFGNST